MVSIIGVFFVALAGVRKQERNEFGPASGSLAGPMVVLRHIFFSG